MEISTKKADGVRRRGRAVDSFGKSQNLGTAHLLQLYRIPPSGNITLQEFESLANERLNVLKCVEEAAQKFVKGTDQYREYLADKFLEKKYRLGLRKSSGVNVADFQRDDVISHFLLRLAFSRTAETRQWFLQQEVDLFQFRFYDENSRAINEFLSVNDLLDFELKPCKTLEADLLEKIAASCGQSTQKVMQWEYCKVPFTAAPSLVRKRKVFLEGGMAYVLRSDLAVLICTRFRIDLSLDLARTNKYFGFLQEEDRLVPLLKKIGNPAQGQQFGSADDKAQVTPEMIDSLSQSSFPLCMRQLHSRLRKDHHLRHGGRMQYGLFLKGIGVTLEDALKFWKLEFTKMMNQETFDKHYAYNIRHNYGKEGKRADYTPYSCAKIIMGHAPGSQDAHGCPFKHSDTQLLRQQLDAFALPEPAKTHILERVAKNQFDQACSVFFRATHRLSESAATDVIVHPNQYFTSSQKLLRGEIPLTNDAGQTTTRVYSQLPTEANEYFLDDCQDMECLLSADA